MTPTLYSVVASIPILCAHWGNAFIVQQPQPVKIQNPRTFSHQSMGVNKMQMMMDNLGESTAAVGTFDPFNFAEQSNHMMDAASMSMLGSSTAAEHVLSSSTNTISFSDQGQNLAGIFFQASLLPYLAFLYFLSFRGNRTPALGNFGWQFLLLFVLSTIPSGIITKGNYGESLADCDWLHGSAEALLTITNLLIVG